MVFRYTKREGHCEKDINVSFVVILKMEKIQKMKPEDRLCTGLGIYKRKKESEQESKHARKKELDQENKHSYTQTRARTRNPGKKGRLFG